VRTYTTSRAHAPVRPDGQFDHPCHHVGDPEVSDETSSTGALLHRLRRARFLSRTIRERGRFMAREALPRRAVSRYRLRDHDTRVSIRHHEHGPAAGSGDAWTLYEVFASADYRFPDPVVAALAQRGPELRLVDIGGNLGFFTLAALSRYPDARVTTFEPDPENAALLRSNLRDNGVSERAEVIEACAHTREGTLTFVGGAGSMSHAAFDGSEGTDLPAIDVLPYLREADLVKLDIEGGEWELLADPRFLEISAAAIAFEYHSVACPGENARLEATNRLREAGYEIHHPRPDLFPPAGPFWGASVLWAYRAP
jgi:FkbM family methyltransferase